MTLSSLLAYKPLRISLFGLLILLLTACGSSGGSSGKASTGTGNSVLPKGTVGKITEFSLPTRNSGVNNIITGPDGNLWFTERMGTSVGRITPTGKVTEFPVMFNTAGIAIGPDHNLWISTGNGMIRMTMTGVSTPLRQFDRASEITLGPDGKLWFTDINQGGIDRIDSTDSATYFPSQASFNGGPTLTTYGITSGPDGNLWFTDDETSGTTYIGRMTPTGTITRFKVATEVGGSYGLSRITTGSDGNLWFTDSDANKIGRITPGGTITEFTVPTSQCVPYGITSGPDGNLWFTENNTNKIGRITPTGTITEYATPSANSYPNEITTGPDGNIWFTEYGVEKIGYIALAK